MDTPAAQPDPMTKVLATFRRQEATDWGNAWVGMEPTFQTEKSVRKWGKMAAKQGGEDEYFTCPYMLKTQKKVAAAIQKKVRSQAQGRNPPVLYVCQSGAGRRPGPVAGAEAEPSVSLAG